MVIAERDDNDRVLCDSCIEAASEYGVPMDSQEEMMDVMTWFGGEIEDHNCDNVEYPVLVRCDCGCRKE